jgi:hypothetical protein
MAKHAAFGNPAIRQFMRDSHNKDVYRSRRPAKQGYKVALLVVLAIWCLV